MIEKGVFFYKMSEQVIIYQLEHSLAWRFGAIKKELYDRYRNIILQKKVSFIKNKSEIKTWGCIVYILTLPLAIEQMFDLKIKIDSIDYRKLKNSYPKLFRVIRNFIWENQKDKIPSVYYLLDQYDLIKMVLEPLSQSKTVIITYNDIYTFIYRLCINNFNLYNIYITLFELYIIPLELSDDKFNYIVRIWNDIFLFYRTKINYVYYQNKIYDIKNNFIKLFNDIKLSYF